MRTNMFFLAIVLLTSATAQCMWCAMGMFGLPIAKTDLNGLTPDRTCKLVNMTGIEIAVIAAWISRRTECTPERLPHIETHTISLGPCNEAAGISVLTSWQAFGTLRHVASITFSPDGAAQAEVEDAFFKITTRPSEPTDKKVFVIGWNPDHPCFASKPQQHGISSEQQHGTKRPLEQGDDSGRCSKLPKLFHAAGQ